MQFSETTSEQDTTQKEVIQLLSQAFHYIVTSGLDIGYVTLGKAVFLLRARICDPGTLWCCFMDLNERSDNDFDVLYTSASLLSTLALMTLNRKKSTAWIQIAENQLCRWLHLHPDLASRDDTLRPESCSEEVSSERRS